MKTKTIGHCLSFSILNLSKQKNSLRQFYLCRLSNFDATSFFLSSPLDVGERFSGRDVINDDDAVGAAIVRRRDGAEPLLAGGVPDLQLHPIHKKFYYIIRIIKLY